MWQTLSEQGKTLQFLAVDRPQATLLILPDGDGVSLSFSDLWTQSFIQRQIACYSLPVSWWSDRIESEWDPVISPEEWLIKVFLPLIPGGSLLREPMLFGLGRGGQGALRLSFKHPKTFPIVASLSADIDHYESYGQGTSLDQLYASREHCRQDGTILHVHPVRQPARLFFACSPDDHRFRGNDRLHEKLVALGVAHEYDFTTRVCGHSWSYYDALAPRVSRFLEEAIQRQSRQLL